VVQVVIGVALVAVALVVALLIQRARPKASPTQAGGWPVPVHLDRTDFERPDAAWLVAVFTSATCGTCAGVVERAQPLVSEAVVVQDVEVTARPDLHQRYRIEAVPITVVADGAGIVRAGFAGPVTATDLWAAVAEVRDPGSSPEPHLGQGTGGAQPA
jgi:hypothetical protein